MEEERRLWLQRLHAATQRALDQLRPLEDPTQQDLIRDLEALQKRIVTEVDFGDGDHW